MAQAEKFTPAQVIAAINKALGNACKAARALRCEADTIYNYRDRYPEVAAAVKAARAARKELRGEWADFHYFDALKAGKPWAVMRQLDKGDPLAILESGGGFDQTLFTLDELTMFSALYNKALGRVEPGQLSQLQLFAAFIQEKGAYWRPGAH